LLEKASQLKSPRNTNYIISLLKDFTGQESLAMSELTKDFVLRFQDFLIKRKLHINSCYSVTHVFLTGINKAITDGYMNDNPFSKIPKTQRFRIQKSLPKFLTIAQIEHLAKTGQGIPDELKLAFFLSCFCGVRWIDCCGLKWEQFTSQKIDGEIVKVLYIEQEKTGVGVYIPLSEQALSIIEQRNEMAQKEAPKQALGYLLLGLGIYPPAILSII
jgi:integrase/recombinase XerD